MDSDLMSEAPLSIRFSCNRCRAHKLKCIPQSDTNPTAAATACKRCARAMVDCVFSRRKKPKRAPRDVVEQQPALARPIDAERLGTLGDPLSPLTPAESTALTSAEPSPMAEEAERVEHMATDGAMIDTTIPEDFSMVDNWSEISRNCSAWQGQHSESPDLEAETLIAQYLHKSSSGDTGANVGLNTDVTNLTHPRNTNATSGRVGNATAAVVGEHLYYDISPHTPSELQLPSAESEVDIKALLRLTSELHERLETLQHSPWSAGHTCEQTLDEYPIGSVLHLCQEFARAAMAARGQDFRGRTATTNIGHKYHQSAWDFVFATSDTADRTNTADFSLSQRRTTRRSTMPAHLDRPSTFILASCSIMLLQLFDTVLSHLQSHLEIQRSIGARAGALSECYTDPTMRFGQLRPVNEGHMRAHTAISVLLDALGYAETALGFHGGNFPDIAGSFLESKVWVCDVLPGHADMAGLQEGFAALRMRATETREMLREIMGL